MVSKYKARKTVIGDRIFDSGIEANISSTLDFLKTPIDGCARVLIVDYQVPFTLIPKSKFGRAIVYKADFVVYFSGIGRVVVEVKGYETPVWKLKERMFREKFPTLELRIVKSTDDVMALAEELYGRDNGAAINSNT